MDKKFNTTEAQDAMHGINVDKADDEKVDKALVDQEIHEINNNPRDTDDVNM